MKPAEISTLKGKTVDVNIWTRINEVESSALDQLRNVTTLPYVFHHVAVMPDVHAGMGCTVGSVVAMKGAVSPAFVGVDIGCGMLAAKTSLDANKIDKKLSKLREEIERRVPVGFESNDHIADSVAHHQLFKEFNTLSPKVQDIERKAATQCGTLGGGNHFIEVCLDTDNNVWVMLHSGSRNIGKTLAEIHMEVAQKLEHNTALVDKALATFLSGTPEMASYRNDLFWAQRYAFLNREIMFERIKEAILNFWPGCTFDTPIMCHHNYVAEEHHFGEDVIVTRKGAIRAGKGEMGIIPGSMGTRSYIVRGLGNPESFESASHGAGRRMSRGQAKKKYTKQDLEKQTEGIECRKDIGVVDEIPAAYKKIEQVIADQADLVEVVTELRQVLCVKG